jgi:hypothetical protein
MDLGDKGTHTSSTGRGTVGVLDMIVDGDQARDVE